MRFWFSGSDHNFAAKRSGAPAGQAEGAGNLCSDPENARFRIALFLISAPGSLMSSGAALSPRRATYFSLSRQRNLRKRKATLLSASLRCATGNLRCSVQPGSSSNSLRSNNRSPCSVWTSAPRRIQKGFAGTGSEADSGSGSSDVDATSFIAACARSVWARGQIGRAHV